MDPKSTNRDSGGREADRKPTQFNLNPGGELFVALIETNDAKLATASLYRQNRDAASVDVHEMTSHFGRQIGLLKRIELRDILVRCGAPAEGRAELSTLAVSLDGEGELFLECYYCTHDKDLARRSAFQKGYRYIGSQPLIRIVSDAMWVGQSIKIAVTSGS